MVSIDYSVLCTLYSLPKVQISQNFGFVIKGIFFTNEIPVIISGILRTSLKLTFPSL